MTVTAAACGSAANVSEAAAPSTGSTAAATQKAPDPTVASPHVNLYMSVLTGGMIGKKGWPEFVPGNFTIPAGSIVDVQIRDFDDGPATIPAGYNKVQGTVGGTMKLIKALNGSIDQQPATTVTQVPANDVAHTLTFSGKDFSLNVPLPPLTTVEFSFKAPAAGTYTWQCTAACGSGKDGWGGPMATDGWMQGVMTVTH